MGSSMAPLPSGSDHSPPVPRHCPSWALDTPVPWPEWCSSSLEPAAPPQEGSRDQHK